MSALLLSRTDVEEDSREDGARGKRNENQDARQAQRGEQDLAQSARRVHGRLDDSDGYRRLGKRRQTHSLLVNASSASVRTATPLGPLGM